VEQQLLPVIVGFVLTGVIGAFLGYQLQNRAWAHQHEVQRHDEERRKAVETYEQVSVLLGRRLYRMRRMYWAVTDGGDGTGVPGEDLASARAEYRDVLAEWNDNLYRVLVLAGTCFGAPVQRVLRDEVQEEFAAAHRGLNEIVKIAAAHGGHAGLPRFGYRLDKLGYQVYELNTWMLRLLQNDSIGRSAPQESAWPAAARAGHRYPGIGDDSNEVRRLQRALRRAGHDVSIDGRYGSRTWLAVRSAQEAAGLEADGIIGPRTWAALPTVSAPLLRPGSAGDDVAALQRVLTQHAPGQWGVCPEAITGTFDTSTSAAVRAFQQWSHITADALVGDHTWNAHVDASGTSLEEAVGREHTPQDPR
jgi:hypothetical protein